MKKRPRLRQSEPERKGMVKSYFDSIVGQERSKTKKYGRGFTVIRVDFDNFEVINDLYGHLHSQGALREFAVLVGNSIRPSDLLITYGGEKFLLVVQGVSETENKVLIERMTRNFMKWNKENGCDDYQLSFRYGTAIFNGTKDLKLVIEEADSEIYNKASDKI